MQTEQGPQGRWLMMAVFVVATGQQALGQKVEPLVTLEAHTEGVTALAFSADGRTLASGSRDGDAKVWEVASGKERATLRGLADTICFLTFSQNAKALAVSTRRLVLIAGGFESCPADIDGFEGRDVLWEVTSVWVMRSRKEGRGFRPVGQREELSLKGAAGSVYCFASSPDGRTAAAGDLAGRVLVWAIASGKARVLLAGPRGPVKAVAFSADGRRLAEAGSDRTVRLWDLPAGKVWAVLKGHTGNICGVAFHPGGRLLASASRDRAIRLWDTATGRGLATSRQGASCWSVAFSPDGRTLATGDCEGRIRLWSIAELLSQQGTQQRQAKEVAAGQPIVFRQ